MGRKPPELPTLIDECWVPFTAAAPTDGLYQLVVTFKADSAAVGGFRDVKHCAEGVGLSSAPAHSPCATIAANVMDRGRRLAKVRPALTNRCHYDIPHGAAKLVPRSVGTAAMRCASSRNRTAAPVTLVADQPVRAQPVQAGLHGPPCPKCHCVHVRRLDRLGLAPTLRCRPVRGP